MPRHARDPRGGAAGREVPSRPDPARSGDPRSRAGQRAGGQGRRFLPRSVSTDCREAEEMSATIWSRPYTLEEVRALIVNMPLHLGIEFPELGPDFLRGRMPV